MEKVVKYANNFLTSSEKEFPFFLVSGGCQHFFSLIEVFLAPRKICYLCNFSSSGCPTLQKAELSVETTFLREFKALTSHMPHNLNIYIYIYSRDMFSMILLLWVLEKILKQSCLWSVLKVFWNTEETFFLLCVDNIPDRKLVYHSAF